MPLTRIGKMFRRPLQAMSLAAGGAILCLIAQGCNDRAFADPLPSEEARVLPAEGGRLILSSGMKGVGSMSITYDGTGGTHIPATIYHLSLDGDTLGVLADASAAVPGTIAIDWPNLSVRATAYSDGRLEVVSGPCFSRQTLHLNFNLHYSGGATYSVPVSVSGIEPFKGVEISYPYSLGMMADEEVEHVSTRRYTNLTGDTTAIILHPYELASVKVTFTPDNPYLPVTGGEPLPIPSPGPEDDNYRPGFYGLEAPYFPGRDVTYPVADADMAVRVKLPPRVSRRYHTFIRRRRVMAYYIATLESPSLSEPVLTTGDVEVNAPVGFIIGYNDDPLVEP